MNPLYDKKQDRGNHSPVSYYCLELTYHHPTDGSPPLKRADLQNLSTNQFLTPDNRFYHPPSIILFRPYCANFSRTPTTAEIARKAIGWTLLYFFIRTNRTAAMMMERQLNIWL